MKFGQAQTCQHALGHRDQQGRSDKHRKVREEEKEFNLDILAESLDNIC